jgi:uncharacterized protein
MSLRIERPSSLQKAFLLPMVLLAGNSTYANSNDDLLPRRIQLGTQVQPVTEETRQSLGLRNTRGVQVGMVSPDSTASESGIITGDVILALGDRNVANPASFVETVSGLRAGKDLEIRLNRGGKELVLVAKPKELPRESSNELELEYASVVGKNGRQRTVLSMPKGKSKLPAFVLLSGLGNGPSEHPTADPLGLKGVAYELNQRGFAVLRVDKPGCGDSQGGPAKDVDFESVVDGYVAGVRELKKHPRIDPDQVFLFAASMGGLQAPLVALREPVKGISVFGAMSCNWPEYMLSTTRRQMKLSGAGAGEIEQVAKLESAGWHYLSHENLSPDAIAEKHLELVDWVENSWSEGKYFSGIHYSFFQQLCHTNVASAWEKFDGSVLAMWGESDFVTTAEDHEYLAYIANQKNAGRGEFKKIAGVDHNLRLAANVEAATKAPSSEPATHLVVAIIDEWAQKLVRKAMK